MSWWAIADILTAAPGPGNTEWAPIFSRYLSFLVHELIVVGVAQNERLITKIKNQLNHFIADFPPIFRVLVHRVPSIMIDCLNILNISK